MQRGLRRFAIIFVSIWKYYYFFSIHEKFYRGETGWHFVRVVHGYHSNALRLRVWKVQRSVCSLPPCI